MTPKHISGALGAALIALSATPAAAQDAPLRVSIGNFTSQQRCTLYAVTSGSEAMVSDRRAGVAVDAYGYAAASRSTVAWARAWRTDLVRDCVTNFQGLRDSVATALAASGRFTVVPPGSRGALVLNGRVSDVGVVSDQTSERGNARSIDEASLTVELALAGPGGGIRFGGSIIKTLAFDEQVQSGSYSSSRSQSDSVTYANLQRELSLAVSRAVAFHIDPIRIVDMGGQRVRVNYGAPLLNVGSSISVDGGVAAGVIRGTVVATGAGFADVEFVGNRDLRSVRVGSVATFAEPEDPGSRTPIYPNVELPGG